ncbi:uncharacterized protein LOC113305684 [Papaver somniferum]|uniref:uncharacterized protein LOC113305684 n=1 Tax=Papaver somniferum TaxID=3469 RepID=UPI000E703C81|nr:uncharacterized protein LOC113305684 [Papaver somniferum]
MKIAFWNIRGIRRAMAKDKLRSLVHNFNPSLVILAEPKVQYSEDFCRKLRLKGMHYEAIHNSTNSRKGNLWILWSSSIQKYSIISITDQAITVEVGSALITVIHANSLTVHRRELWCEMEEVSSLNKPWLAIGDFNSVLREEEKKGEAVYNDKWIDSYPRWAYKVGARWVSDHSTLFGWNNSIPKLTNVPFIALKVWKNRSGFLPLIKDSWSKAVKEEEILNYTIASDQEPENTILLNKQVTARGKVEVISQQQKDIIQQKSRVMWLKDGASNTKFFHVNMKIRQAQNMIVELEDDDGNIVTSQRDIASNLVAHFEEKFKF